MFFYKCLISPGSEKSTLARAIAKFTKAAIIDLDIVKTGLLEGLELEGQDKNIDPKRPVGLRIILNGQNLTTG
ncbi:hypothetical protein [Paenibacillus physcomitrellae]|uniref:Uncharacterized protein n=1 Tax=Paenibacillus physcomitrellae TaxID=1619311 RepID=A0ABQ1FZ32_9BACL|nr:hypothetical protein [Paenibacillus physcomitrellae]GGA32035.1 hypothetical protein GCM10010917_16480 [Paenibacillus physcomitrellae]